MASITRFWSRPKQVKPNQNVNNISKIPDSELNEIKQQISGIIVRVNNNKQKVRTIDETKASFTTAIQKINEEIHKIETQLTSVSVNNTSSTEIQELNERLSGITPQILALTRLVNEKNDQITTLRSSLNEIKEDIEEFKSLVDVDDVSRETRIIGLENQIKALFKSTALELKEGITGDLKIVSSSKIHYLMGYIVLSSDLTNPIICDLPDVAIFSPVAHIGVNKRNHQALPFTFNNNRNSVTLKGAFKANDICYFNHLIRIDT